MRNHKNALLLFLVIGLATTVHAQGNEDPEPSTIFGRSKIAFAARFDIRLTQIDGNPGVMISPSVGLLVNNQLYVGAEYNTLVNKYYTRDASYIPVSDEQAYWQLSYGGARVIYTVNSLKAVNIGFGALVGGGTVSREFICNSLSEESPQYVNFNQKLKNDGRFIVIEPAVNLGVNLTRAIKFDASVGYRMVSGADRWGTVGMNDGKFNGASLSIGLRVIPARL